MKQFDSLRKRNAFVDNYRQFRMFRDGFEEFDHARSVFLVFNIRFILSMICVSRPFSFFLDTCGCFCSEVVQSLIDEYQAAEKADYLSWSEPATTAAAGVGAGAAAAAAGAASSFDDFRMPQSRSRSSSSSSSASSSSEFDEKE